PLGKTTSWSQSPARTITEASLSAPLPLAKACEPPLATSPLASSIEPAALRRSIAQAIPSPPAGSPSATEPLTRTSPSMGLFQPTTTPLVGPGWTEIDRGGRRNVSSLRSSALALAVTDGVSPGPFQATTPEAPWTTLTGVVMGLYVPRPTKSDQRRSANGWRSRLAANSASEPSGRRW